MSESGPPFHFTGRLRARIDKLPKPPLEHSEPPHHLPWIRCSCGKCANVFTGDGQAFVHTGLALGHEYAVDPICVEADQVAMADMMVAAVNALHAIAPGRELEAAKALPGIVALAKRFVAFNPPPGEFDGSLIDPVFAKCDRSTMTGALLGFQNLFERALDPITGDATLEPEQDSNK